MSRRIHFVMDEEFVARIDAAKQVGESRGAFVRRAVELALPDPPAEPIASEPNGAAKPGAVVPPEPDRLNVALNRIRTRRVHAPNCRCPICSS